jgi:hypothetical protein
VSIVRVTGVTRVLPVVKRDASGGAPGDLSFRNEKLIPAIRDVGGDDAVAPNVTTNPAHRVITA